MTGLDVDSPVRTPHLERLAARGSWFTRAYCEVPSCAPSRAAFLTGVHAHKSGVYFNNQAFRRTTAPIARAVTLQRHFLDHGYLTAGYGKIAHTSYQDDNLADYTPGYFKGHAHKKYVRHNDNDLVPHILPETLRIPDPSYLPTRFDALPDDWDRDDPAKLQQDTEQANRAIAFLGTGHDRPFFLSVGFWRPRSERIVPKRYFDLYPLESIRIPPGYRADDLEDVPAPGRRQATHQGTHAAVVNAGLWREYLRSYYASVTYIDEQIGRVLDGIDLAPVLRAERKDRGKPVLSTFGIGNHSITDGRHRYIRYFNGDEEFYDHAADRHEWTNLAADPRWAAPKTALARLLPAADAPEIEHAGRRDGSELHVERFKTFAPSLPAR